MIESIKNIMNTVFYWNTIWKIILSIMIFLILYFTINVLLKKLDSLNKEESEKKWVNYLSKIMNNFPRWIFVMIEIYVSISILSFSDKIELVLKSIFLWVIIIFAI